MQPMIEGLYQVATPPNGAGQRGKVERYDWTKIAEELRRRPHCGFIALDVRSDAVDDLKMYYPDITFLGFNHRLVKTAGGKESKMCHVYVQFPKAEE